LAEKLAARVTEQTPQGGFQGLSALLVNGQGDELFLSKNGPMLAALSDLDSDKFFTHWPECGRTRFCIQKGWGIALHEEIRAELAQAQRFGRLPWLKMGR
jgi:hypothetical protein